MKLTHEQSIDAVKECLARCRAVGGVFTLVWHNNHMLDAEFRSLYLRLLPFLVDAERYDWASDCRTSPEK
jgi:hypothetical protein